MSREVFCSKPDNFFREVSLAVRDTGISGEFGYDVRTMTMTITYPDRKLRMGMNHVRALGRTGSWRPKDLPLPTGGVAKGFSQIDEKRAVAVFSIRYLEAVKEGHRLRTEMYTVS